MAQLKRNDPVWRFSDTVAAAESFRHLDDEFAWTADDWSKVAAASSEDHARWLAELRVGEAAIRRARLRIESYQSGSGRECEFCGGPVIGRSDARYCSTAHRVAGNRAAARRDPETIKREKVDGMVGLVNDIRLYVGHIGNSRDTAKLPPEAKGHIVSALREAIANLED